MALSSTVGQAAGMAASLASRIAGHEKTWKDRIKPGAYTSPSGKRILFAFEDVRRGFDIRGTMFEFAGVDGGYPQQTGFGPRQYPLACFFTGGQCDLLATAFEAALLEPGTGQLEHPLYGTIPVVPFGAVERNDTLKTAANQSVVTVTFFTTIGAIYPSALTNGQNEINAAIANFNLAAAQQFASGVPNLSGVTNALSAIATIKGLLKKVQNSLAKISDAVASVRADMAKGFAAINGGMDVLIGQPLQLALQISNLIQAPGRALIGIESRLDSYSTLATNIFGSSAGNPGAALSEASILLAHQTLVANDFHISNLFALSAVSGSLVAVAAQPISSSTQGLASGTGAFQTRAQVVAAAATVLAQLDAAISWRDAGFSSLTGIDTPANYQIDTGESYQALQSATALAAGYLLQASFSLIPERAVVLTRARTIIDLAAELYGSVDDKLDLLINTNNLSGDELLELPAGRRILYYPQAA